MSFLGCPNNALRQIGRVLGLGKTLVLWLMEEELTTLGILGDELQGILKENKTRGQAQMNQRTQGSSDQ
jgi:hypothetical protein